MTTQRESRMTEGRLSWLDGAYTQVNERLGDLARRQKGLREEIAALSRRQDSLREETNSRFNSQNLFQGAMWAAMWMTMVGGFITFLGAGGGA